MISFKGKGATPRSSNSPLKRKKSLTKVTNPLLTKCVEMGFPQSHVEYALKELKVENPRPEVVVAWLLDHPEVLTFNSSPFFSIKIGCV